MPDFLHTYPLFYLYMNICMYNICTCSHMCIYEFIAIYTCIHIYANIYKIQCEYVES